MAVRPIAVRWEPRRFAAPMAAAIITERAATPLTVARMAPLVTAITAATTAARTTAPTMAAGTITVVMATVPVPLPEQRWLVRQWEPRPLRRPTPHRPTI